jgi:tripartite ATP-independent transporter DctP family solute receptor
MKGIKYRKMLKKAVVVLLSLMLLFAISACGGGGADGGSADAGSAAVAGSGATADKDASYTIRVGHVEAEGSYLHKSLLEFEKFMEEGSDGRVDVQLYPNSELGDDATVLQSIQMGSVEMSICSSSVLSQFDPKFNVIFLPFMFSSAEECEAALRGDFGDMYNAWMEAYGLKGLAWQYDGARNIGNTKRPILKLEDVKGLKLRCMNSDIFIEMFRLMGANATPMAYSEIYTSVQNGVVDGNDNPAGLFVESKFYEVHKYYSLTGHVYGTANAVISKAFYDKLPEDIKALVDEGSATYLEDWQITQARNAEQEYTDTINENGCAVNELDPGEKERFAEALAPLYEKIKAEVGDEVWTELEGSMGRKLG